MTPDDWFADDPFADPNDPRAIEREKRRRERDERRRKREAKEAQAKAAAPPPAPAPSAPQPQPAAPAPMAAGPPPPPPPPPSEAETPAPETPAPPVEDGDLPPAPPPLAPSFEEGFWGEKPPAEADPGRPRRRWRIRPALVVMALAAIALLWFLNAFFQPFHGAGSGHVAVTIPKGAGVSEVGNILESKDVIPSSFLFEGRVTLAGKRSSLYPGRYTLAHDMSYGDAIDALSTPPVKRTTTATIPEGLSRAQVAPLVRSAGITGSYMAATSGVHKGFDPARYGAPKGATLEGFLFPSTYELPKSPTVDDLVNRQLAAFKQRMGGVDMSYARSKNLTPFDVLTIASMIEREVQVPRERPLVAAVIYNRLRKGIPLGIDATTRYAVGNYTEPLTPEQLASGSPYNTRVVAGLPPGPIGNPGIASIEAAAHPAKSGYIYYVVKPGTCGEHSFSTTYAQFQRDVARYDAARAAAGGKSPDSC
jgi:uncharacterized YceG family protein